MKLIKNGFTIAEMLICLAIIAMVIALVIPAAMSKKPNRNKAMFRKAYYNLERAVGELVNDESTFPSTKSYDYPSDLDRSTLFAYFIPKDEIAGSDYNKPENQIEIAGEDSKKHRDKGNTGFYFCSQVASKLNTSGKVICNKSRPLTSAANGQVIAETTDDDGSTFLPNFITNDGVAWFINAESYYCAREELPDGTVVYRGNEAATTCTHEAEANGDLIAPTGDGSSGSDFLCFQLDVNGADKPNCRTDYTTNGVLHRCSDPDRFEVCVYYDGRIQVPAHSGREAEYLRSNSIID